MLAVSVAARRQEPRWKATVAQRDAKAEAPVRWACTVATLQLWSLAEAPPCLLPGHNGGRFRHGKRSYADRSACQRVERRQWQVLHMKSVGDGEPDSCDGFLCCLNACRVQLNRAQRHTSAADGGLVRVQQCVQHGRLDHFERTYLQQRSCNQLNICTRWKKTTGKPWGWHASRKCPTRLCQGQQQHRSPQNSGVCKT